MPRSATLLLVVGAALVLGACGGGDGGPRRTIVVTQTDDACAPDRIDVGAGEHITFNVKNDGKKDREVEGIDGMKLEEVLVPSGRSRSIDWTAPKAAGVQKLKCYVPGGNTVIIEITVAADSSAKTTKKPNDTVNVNLIEFAVTPDKPSVAAGPVKFVARNTSQSMVHELAILKKKADGSFDNLGEIENIAAGKSGEVVLDLPAGQYQLACLIAKGEAGSNVDHFQSGMKTDFEVK